jgi:hypothetical protein
VLWYFRFVLTNINVRYTEQPLSIDLGHYIKIKSVSCDETNADQIDESTQMASMKTEYERQLKEILDQKNYLEERNHQLRFYTTSLVYNCN